MRYLVLFNEETTQSAALPPPVIWEAVEATNHYLREMKASGKATDVGFWATGHGGYAIWNTNNAAELHTLIESVPARAFCSVQSYPILETDDFPAVFNKLRSQFQPMVDKIQKSLKAWRG
jgi:hypothetical protein